MDDLHDCELELAWEDPASSEFVWRASTRKLCHQGLGLLHRFFKPLAESAALPTAFSAGMVAVVDSERRRWLDQTAYRFMKLQDSLGEKVLPGLLAATLDPLPPEATFAERLQRLERLGALSSVERWRLLREVGARAPRTSRVAGGCTDAAGQRCA